MSDEPRAHGEQDLPGEESGHRRAEPRDAERVDLTSRPGPGNQPSRRHRAGAHRPGSGTEQHRDVDTAAAPDDHRHRGLWFIGRTLIALLAVVVLVGTGVEWSIKSSADAGIQARSIHAVFGGDSHIVAPTRAAAAAPVGTYPAENILLLGSDSRAGANGNAGNNDGSIDTAVAQSDTLMIAHVSADRQHVTVLSIPRDLEIDAPTCKQWSNGVVSDTDWPVAPGEMWKITNAYAVGGPACTVRAVQQLTGLRIDRVIGIDFAGFKAMVDAVGGVQVNICQPIIDTELGTVIPTAGQQVITGDTALNLVRARQVHGDPTGDLGRIRRQQIVLSALLREVTGAGTLLSPAKLDGFLQAFVRNTHTDNVTIDDLLTLAQSFGAPDPSKVTFHTLPTHVSATTPDALTLDTATAAAVFQALVNDHPLPGAPTTRPAPSTAATALTPSPDNAPPTGPPGSADLPPVNAGQPLCA